jgi:hypothetical protein
MKSRLLSYCLKYPFIYYDCGMDDDNLLVAIFNKKKVGERNVWI